MNRGTLQLANNGRSIFIAVMMAVPLACVAAAKGDDAAKSVVMSAESSAGEVSTGDGLVQTVSNASFSFSTLYNPKKQGNVDNVLLAQRIHLTQRSGREGVAARLEAVVWLGNKGKYETKLWALEECADSAWRAGDLFLTSKYGVGGTENMLRAYSFATGKYLFSYTGEPVQADIYIPKDVIKRHFAYVAKSGTGTECRDNEMPRGAIGALVLSDGVTQLDRLVVEGEGDELIRSPRLALIDKKETKGTALLSVWGPAEYANRSEVVKGFSLKLLYQDGSELVIPVANDKFDLEHAVRPPALKLRRIEVEKVEAGK